MAKIPNALSDKLMGDFFLFMYPYSRAKQAQSLFSSLINVAFETFLCINKKRGSNVLQKIEINQSPWKSIPKRIRSGGKKQTGAKFLLQLLFGLNYCLQRSPFHQ